MRKHQDGSWVWCRRIRIKGRKERKGFHNHRGMMDMGNIVGALGGIGGQRDAVWMAALGSVMKGQGALRSMRGEMVSFPADVSAKAMAVSAYSAGFLAAGALQLDRFVSSTSKFMEQFKEHNDQSRRRHQHLKAGWDGGSRLQIPLNCSEGFRIPSNMGANIFGTGILLYTPWGSIVRFIEGKPKYRSRLKVSMAASPGGEEGPSSSPKIAAAGIGSKARQWTNVILGVNLLVFLAQIGSQGRLLLLGAKVNSLIDQGQLWRLMTPSLLHANIMHLLVNCYSLNSVGPTVESLGGGKRFLAVYTISALASSGLSYTLCTAPSVGASGAIFGLVGALAVFLARHKTLMSGGDKSLAQVGRIIAINLAFGLLSDGIDNWGHVGGLLGGAAVAWLLGPALSFESPPGGGKRLLFDRPPIARLIPPRPKRQW